MRRVFLLLVGIGLLVSACSSELGRALPECDRTSANATLVLAVQSVPGARYISCVEGLKAGWSFQDLVAESGRSSYTLDSDRMGFGFLRVDNVLSCDLGDAERVVIPDLDIELWEDVESLIEVDIVVIPETTNRATMDRTIEVVLELEETQIRGREVIASTSTSADSTAARIEKALAAGAHVIVISVRDAEEGTLTLLVQGRDGEIEVSDLDTAIETIEAAETDAKYVGNWYYVFEGGCVVYSFDAHGSGVESIEDDVRIALSLYDAEELRQSARNLGYRIR
ncbi:MAG TPA: hypothetical protein VLA29_03205 [Acidimicrobiia bacterium]|nr:hypothetical protein [Acidimicrobiia bacterium]